MRRVIQPILAGETVAMDDVFDDDLRYVLDLGLVKSPPLRMANPIYTEVVARVLSAGIQHVVMADPRSFVRADWRFDLAVLLREFAAFWIENGAILTKNLSYQEAAPQLVLMAFLQRVVNGGGIVTREAIELKVWRDGRKDPLPEGLKQIDVYLAGLGLEEGVLVLFDQRTAAVDVEERTHEEAAETASGKRIRVLRA